VENTIEEKPKPVEQKGGFFKSLKKTLKIGSDTRDETAE
jgi:hypothetical protein